MSYTYDPALADDISIVRFHIGDVVEAGHYLEDETIQYLINLVGLNPAVLRCIRYIITRLSVPDEHLGSYSISRASALQGYKELLKAKSQELGATLTASQAVQIKQPWRADSYMTDGTQDGTP